MATRLRMMKRDNQHVPYVRKCWPALPPKTLPKKFSELVLSASFTWFIVLFAAPETNTMGAWRAHTCAYVRIVNNGRITSYYQSAVHRSIPLSDGPWTGRQLSTWQDAKKKRYSLAGGKQQPDAGGERPKNQDPQQGPLQRFRLSRWFLVRRTFFVMDPPQSFRSGGTKTMKHPRYFWLVVSTPWKNVNATTNQLCMIATTS